jgi:hypothetical protein
MADHPKHTRPIDQALAITLRDGLERLEELTLALAYDAGGQLFEQVALETQPDPSASSERQTSAQVIRLDPKRGQHNNNHRKAGNKIA